jgi:hypothetical protein
LLWAPWPGILIVMSTTKRPLKKTTAKKAKVKVRDLATKKDPKGGPTPKSKRVVILESS